ncbi:MAG: hypothetical protein RL062_1459 [Bacteroidota bacterium]|jgi:phage I-like protein
MIIAIGFSMMAQAQKQDALKPNDEAAKKRENRTKELNLTPEESDKFWSFTDSFKEQQSSSKLKIKTAQENLAKSKSKKEFIKTLEEIDAEKIEMIKNRQQYLKNCYDFLGQERTLKVMNLDQKRGRMKKREEEHREHERPHRKRKSRHSKSEK